MEASGSSPPTVGWGGEVVRGGGCCPHVRLPPHTCLRNTIPAPAQMPGEGTLGATWPQPSLDLVSLSLSANSKVPRSPVGATSPSIGATVLTEAPDVPSAVPGRR